MRPSPSTSASSRSARCCSVEWRGRAIYVVHRTEEMLGDARRRTPRMLRDPASEESDSSRATRQNEHRSIQPAVSRARRRVHALRLRAAAALRGGAGGSRADWPGGFYCPCHGSKFDLAGPRVRRRSGARRTCPCRRTATSTTTRFSSAPTQGTHNGEYRSGCLRSAGPWLERARRVDRRSLPDDEAHQGARHRVLRVEELQLLVRLRRHRDGRARAAARHGHFPDDELQAGLRRMRSRRSSTSCATSNGDG